MTVERSFFVARERASERMSAFVVPGLRPRPCRNADLPFLRRLYRSTRADELARTGWPDAIKRAFCDQQFEAQHRDWTTRHPDAWFLLLLEKRDPVGRLYVDESGDDARLIDISLMPAARGRGLGSALLAALIAWANAAGKGVALSVDPMNPRAAALYRRWGFIETGRDDARVHMRRPSGDLAGPAAPDRSIVLPNAAGLA